VGGKYVLTCRSIKGTGYMWLSPLVLILPNTYIWPCSALTQVLVWDAATTQSGGHAFRSPP